MFPSVAADRSAETLLIRVTVSDRDRDIPRFYLVSAGNFGGSSRDVPAP